MVAVMLEVDESAYVTEQLPGDRLHVPLEGVKDPVELLDVKDTVPDGEEEPVTVAVHVVNLPTLTDDGEHESVRDDWVTTSIDVEAWLSMFARSPR